MVVVDVHLSDFALQRVDLAKLLLIWVRLVTCLLVQVSDAVDHLNGLQWHELSLHIRQFNCVPFLGHF